MHCTVVELHHQAPKGVSPRLLAQRLPGLFTQPIALDTVTRHLLWFGFTFFCQDESSLVGLVDLAESIVPTAGCSLDVS